MMFSLILCILLIGLFAFLDVWYFVRSIEFGLRRLLPAALGKNTKRRWTKNEVFHVSRVRGIVLPSDMDWLWHMNNSKYLRELDFGRFELFSNVLYPAGKKLGSRFVLNAISIRYRRSLLLWQRFTIESRILCWKDDGLYLEQRFVGDRDGFIYATALAKTVVRGNGQTMNDVMETVVGEDFPSPPPPQEVIGWIESIAKSSESLKNERRN